MFVPIVCGNGCTARIRSSAKRSTTSVRFIGSRPRASVVLSIDEKTGIQAIERKHVDRAPQPGRLRRREFEYVRHGTQALIAAMDVHSGRVIGSCTDRRTQADLVAFMEEVAQPTQGARACRVGQPQHPPRQRCGPISTPDTATGSSFTSPRCSEWVNQIECCSPSIHVGSCVTRAIHRSSICESAPKPSSPSATCPPGRSSGLLPASSCKLANP